MVTFCNCVINVIKLAKPLVHQVQEFRGVFVNGGPCCISGFALGGVVRVLSPLKGLLSLFHVKLRCW